MAEVNRHAPKAIKILVGTMSDMAGDKSTSPSRADIKRVAADFKMATSMQCR